MTRRKPPTALDSSNVAPDGEYLVGKNRPPEAGKFRAGDGRPRGRRKKGTKNLATDFNEEMATLVTVLVGGTPRRVTRQRAILMRLADNATKGQNPAIAMTLEYRQRFVDPVETREQVAPIEKKGQYDYNRLTLPEKLALEYLLLKAEGLKPPDNHPEIIVKPFDWNKKLQDDRERNREEALRCEREY